MAYMNPNQHHHGGGDNVQRDKITYNNFYGSGDVTIPRYLTLIPSAGDVIGRDEQLKLIRERLKSNQSVVLVNGLGGIGKTTIALEYINRYGSNYQHLAWIEVTDHIATAFVTNNTLIRNLQLRAAFDQLPPETYETQGFELLLNALSNLDDCLLVIDNANQLEDLQSCRRLLRGLRATTLLTSRAKPEEWNIVQINELAKRDAADLFMRHFDAGVQPEQMDTLWQLLERLGYHTLLIELMAKAATKARLSLEKLNEKIQANYLRDADLNARAISTGAHADHTGLATQARVANYIQMVFRQISDLSETEQRYLRYLCLLPSNFYTEDFLAEVFQIDADTKAEYLDTLESLTQKGWIAQKREAEGYTYKLHALVQEVAVQELGISYEQCAPVVDYWIDALSIDQTKDNPIEKFAIVQYGEYILEKLQENEHEKIPILIDRIVWINIYLGKFKTAALNGEKGLEMSIILFGEDHKEIAVRQNDLGVVYRNLGEYKRARNLLEAALASDITNFGDQHPTVATRQSNLAMVYSDLGNYNRACNLLEAALAFDIKHFGDQHPNVAVRQSNLALVYKDLGKYDKALDLLEAALASDITNFGEQHPTVAVSQSNLANVYSDLGEYNKARDLLETALAADITNFGEQHPKVATRYNNLAWVYRKQEDWVNAKALFEKAYQIWLQTLGERHPHTQKCAESLVYVQAQLEQSDDA